MVPKAAPQPKTQVGLASSVINPAIGKANPNVAAVGATSGMTPPAPQAPSAPQAPAPMNPYVQPAALASTGSGLIGQKASDIAAQYGQQIADVGKEGAMAGAGYSTTGTTPVAEGNAAVIAKTTAAQQQALAAGEAAALQGTGQQLTAQQQEQTGLLGAAGLAKPEGNFPMVFNPLTGTYSAPGIAGGSSSAGHTLTYDPAKDAPNLADMVMNRDISYADAIQGLSYGSNGANAAAQLSAAILAKGGNPTDLQAQAAGQASVAGSIPQLQAYNTAAEGIKNTITSYLSQNPNLNFSNLAAVNAVQQWAQGKQLADPKYQTLFNYLNEYTNTLAPILGVGGNVTNLKTEIAQGFVNTQANGGSIADVLNNISDLSTAKIQNMATGAKGNTTPTAGGQGSFVEGQTTSSGGYNFKIVNGKWVPST